jgi:signal transduction histidine kinase
MTYETFLSAVHPDDREYVDRKWTAALRGEHYDIEHRIIVGNDIRWVRERAELEFDEKGILLGGFGTVQDITERKQAEAELAHLASFPELNPSPVLELDAAGNVKYLNPAAKTRFPDLSTQESKHPFLTGWEALVSRLRSENLRFLTRDINIGDSWYEKTLSPVPSNQNFRLYGRDITARKQAEEQLGQRTAELEASNKELEAFTYSVSHDLRAPLRSMEGFSDALLEDYGDKLDEQGKQYLMWIQESSNLMAQLIDDMLKLSRITRSEIAERITAELRKRESDRKVEFAVSPGLIANGDSALLRIVLENLLGNAWKFTGHVALPKIEMGMTEYNGRKAYFVRDNGAGFDAKYSDKLFRPFQRLHKSSEFPGTGVGLATVQRIIRRHGGEVWAEGKINKGATFYFTLPVA